MVSKIRRCFDWYAWYAVMVLAILVVLVLGGATGREAWKAGVFGKFLITSGLLFLVIYTSNIFEKRNLDLLLVRGLVHTTVGWILIVIALGANYFFGDLDPWSWNYWLTCTPIILWFLLVGKKK